MLAQKANLRYDMVINAAEQAEMRVERKARSKDYRQVKHKDQGIAAILSSGNYNAPSRQERDLMMHPDGFCALYAPVS